MDVATEPASARSTWLSRTLERAKLPVLAALILLFPSLANAQKADEPDELFIPAKSQLVNSKDATRPTRLFRSDQILVSTGNKVEQEFDFSTSGELPLQ